MVCLSVKQTTNDTTTTIPLWNTTKVPQGSILGHLLINVMDLQIYSLCIIQDYITERAHSLAKDLYFDYFSSNR